MDKKQLHEQAEIELESWASALTPEGLRKAFHIPFDDELKSNGFTEEAAGIETAMEYQVTGVERAIDLRLRDGRQMVVGFNKIKHLLLAVPRETHNDVMFPRYKGRNEEDGSHRAQVPTASCDPDKIRWVASTAIISQAVLNNLLSLILWFRFDEPHDSPAWAVSAMELPGWYEEDKHTADGAGSNKN
jgi:hypothetical protein